jgi:hypothetical protein
LRELVADVSSNAESAVQEAGPNATDQERFAAHFRALRRLTKGIGTLSQAMGHAASAQTKSDDRRPTAAPDSRAAEWVPGPDAEELLRRGDEERRLDHWRNAERLYGEVLDGTATWHLRQAALLSVADVLVDHFALLTDEVERRRPGRLYKHVLEKLKKTGRDPELTEQAQRGLVRWRALMDAR